MKNLFIFSIFISLIGLSSCGKDGESVKIGAPTYSTPSKPFTVNTDEEDQDTLNILNIKRGDPCYPYIRHEIVKPVASCTSLENGRIKESYKITVQSGKLCVLRKSFPNGVHLYTVIGDIRERQKNQNITNYRVDIFGQSKEDDGLLTFEMKADNTSKVKYNIAEDSLTVRQVSKLWKKRKRYFRFSCRSISNIVN
ncbi:MAG: hypothetical protein CME70_17640 [Halobacteriovorax sp.]|nr:hypothetical protein [Halobacteriovorax sp.]